MEDLSIEELDCLKDDEEIAQLQGRIENAQKVHDETRARWTLEERKLKDVEEKHKQIQKEFYMCKLTHKLEKLESDIKKEQGLYDSCSAKRKHVEEESERLFKSKSDKFVFK